MAGSHALNMLYVMDEASGIDDGVFNSVFGSLTEDDNYLLMLSNPRRLNGFFYESQQYKSKDTYAQLHMNAIKSDFVTQKSIDNWKNLYGEESNQYMVEVLGEFPLKEDESIIPYDLYVKGIENSIDDEELEDIPIIWGADIAAGNDKSVLVKRQGPKVFDDIKRWKYHDTMKVVGKIVQEYEETPDELKPIRIYVDSIGVGKGAYDRLKEKGLPVYAAVASKKAIAKKYITNQKYIMVKHMKRKLKIIILIFQLKVK